MTRSIVRIYVKWMSQEQFSHHSYGLFLQPANALLQSYAALFRRTLNWFWHRHQSRLPAANVYSVVCRRKLQPSNNVRYIDLETQMSKFASWHSDINQPHDKNLFRCQPDLSTGRNSSFPSWFLGELLTCRVRVIIYQLRKALSPHRDSRWEGSIREGRFRTSASTSDRGKTSLMIFVERFRNFFALFTSWRCCTLSITMGDIGNRFVCSFHRRELFCFGRPTTQCVDKKPMTNSVQSLDLTARIWR